ncbi:MAG: tetratricopeptide repeat protein [Alphaproteobacteria bacterium]|nr:tetratricopeptide repeat protein [Alphaproteobacteria bacterium]
MSDTVAELLLAGEPVRAEVEAVARLERSDADDAARIGLVRARVALGRPEAAREALVGLGRDTPHHRVAHALAALASGEPSRAKAILLDDSGDLLVLVTRSEVTRASGDPAVATQLAARARDAAEGGDPRWVAIADLQLARCIADSGDLGVGRALAERAHAAFQEHGPGTVLEAEALDVAGALARKDGDPLVAVAMHERALGIWLATCPAESALVAGCRYSLAQALHRADDFPRALTEMQSAFLATQQAFGPDHLDTWITRFELGRMEVDNGEMLDGFPRMEAARAEVAKRLGRQHPVVRAMDRLL